MTAASSPSNRNQSPESLLFFERSWQVYHQMAGIGVLRKAAAEVDVVPHRRAVDELDHGGLHHGALHLHGAHAFGVPLEGDLNRASGGHDRILAARNGSHAVVGRHDGLTVQIRLLQIAAALSDVLRQRLSRAVLHGEWSGDGTAHLHRSGIGRNVQAVAILQHDVFRAARRAKGLGQLDRHFVVLGFRPRCRVCHTLPAQQGGAFRQRLGAKAAGLLHQVGDRLVTASQGVVAW